MHDLTVPKILLYVITSAIGWGIAFVIHDAYKRWRSKKCRLGHNKKYSRVFRSYDWTCPKEHIHGDDVWVWAGEWFCEQPGCLAVGFNCFGNRGVYKIEFGQVVIDEKGMANPEVLLSPAQLKIQRQEEARAKGQGVAKAVSMNEAMELLTNLAVLAKKGQVVPGPGVFQVQATTITPAPGGDGKPDQKKET